MVLTLPPPAEAAAVARLPQGRTWLPVKGAAWFSITAVFMAGLAPVFLIASTPLNSLSSGAWWLAWLLVIVVGFRYAWIVGLGERRLFETVFWLFTYVFLGLAPLVQMRSGRYPSTTPFTDETLNAPTVGVVALGAAAFAVGLVAAGRRPVSETGLTRIRGASRVIPHRILIMSIGSLLFTTAYILAVGPSAFFLSREGRAAVEQQLIHDITVYAVIKAAATLPLVICFAGLVQLRRQRHAVGRKLSPVLAILILIELAIVVNPISTPRYFAGTAVLTVICTLGAISTAHRTRVFIVSLAAALVLVFPYAAVSRTADSTDQQRVGPVATLGSPDFDSFLQINNTIAYVHQRGTTHGGQLVGAVFFFVPRQVWPTKPIDTGPFLARYNAGSGQVTYNLSAPLWAELFINGGWFLVGLGMALLGYVVRRADLRSSATSKRGVRPGVLGLSLPFYLILVLRGSLLQAMAGLTVLVVCGLFVSTSKPERAPT